MGIQEILIRRIRNDLHIHWSFNISVDYANQKWVEMVIMNYKEIMDLWYVWMPVIAIVFRYIKGVVDNWND